MRVAISPGVLIVSLKYAIKNNNATMSTPPPMPPIIRLRECELALTGASLIGLVCVTLRS